MQKPPVTLKEDLGNVWVSIYLLKPVAKTIEVMENVSWNTQAISQNLHRQMTVQHFYVCLGKLCPGKQSRGSGELLSLSHCIAEKMTTSTHDFG